MRINRRIRVKEVFVIASDGTKLGVLPTEDALKRAMEEGLDLVEVNPMSRPPVCKLMDYGKFKYEQKKKAGEAKKKQKVILVKEVKLRPKTDDHDFNFKVEHLKRFLGEGDKAKVTIMFRGREITHPEIGRQVLERVVEALKDFAVVESFPRMEGRNMYMMLAPGKGAVPIVKPPPPSVIAAQAKMGIPTPGVNAPAAPSTPAVAAAPAAPVVAAPVAPVAAAPAVAAPVAAAPAAPAFSPRPPAPAGGQGGSQQGRPHGAPTAGK